VVVLVTFMLIRREDLRNRLVRLVAHGRLIITTRAFEEGARRLSRFLFSSS
jgi:predicted PurR-regulated permease PerM